jgi:hypothetical protein
MTLNVEIYEMNYAVSPGGVDCWEVSIDNDWCVSDFKTAGDALNYVLDKYPHHELNLNVKSLNWNFKEFEKEYA